MSIYINHHDVLRNQSSSDRATFFAWCYAAIYAVTIIVAIVPVLA